VETDDDGMTEDITFQDAITFLWQEADLLDRRAYDEWLDLWAEDGLYIIPIEKDVEDYATVLNYVFDDTQMRRMRVARLTSSQSMSAASAAETVRTVSRFVKTGAEKGVIRLRAAQHLAEYHRDKHRLMPATLDVELRREDGEIKIVRKIVTLSSREDGIQGIGYLL